MRPTQMVLIKSVMGQARIQPAGLSQWFRIHVRTSYKHMYKRDKYGMDIIHVSDHLDYLGFDFTTNMIECKL